MSFTGESRAEAGRRVTRPSNPAGLSTVDITLCLMVAAFACGLGALTLVLGQSWLLYSFIVSPAIIIAGYLLAGELIRCRINVFVLTFTGTLLWYFTPLVAGGFGLPILMPEDPYSTGISISIVTLYLAILCVLFVIFPRPVVKVDWASVVSDRAPLSVLLLLICILQVFLISTGQWTYRGISLNGNLGDKPLLLFMGTLSAFSGPIAAGLLAFLLRSRSKAPLSMAICVACVLASLMWFFVDGRRAFAVCIAMEAAAFFPIFWAGRSNRQKIIQGSISLVLGLIIISTAWQAFFMVRLSSSYIQRGAGVPNIVEMYAQSEAIDRRVFEAKYQSNISSRATIINSVTTFRETSNGFVGGQSLLNSVIVSLPSAFFPGKDEWEKDAGGGNTEKLWSDRLGVPSDDYANSLFLDGYADLWLFGSALYVMIVNMLIWICRKLSMGDRTATSIVTFIFLYQSMNIEGAISAYLSGARNVVLLLIIWMLTVVIMRFASRASGEVGQSRVPGPFGRDARPAGAGEPRVTGARR